jgi:hypothetical protein
MTPVAGAPDEGDLQTVIDRWSQGDCTLGELPILWGFAQDHPLTATATEQAGEGEPVLGVTIAAEAVEGLVVVSQTCDIVRGHSDRPYVQVAPLVRTDEVGLDLVRARMRPRFAYLPALADECLIADLDRVFTVEKTLLARWERIPSCEDEGQRRSFSETIRRYYNRPAFPEAFVQAVRGLEAWFRDKHDRWADPPKKGPTPFHPGACLRALEMVLVRANPAWEAPTFHVDVLLVRKSDEDGISAETWKKFMDACKGKVTLPAHITSSWHEMPLLHLQAKRYLESEVLDLDYLSDGSRRTS